MNIVKQYNNLHNKEVTRSTLKSLLAKSNHLEVTNRLDSILKNNPDTDLFVLNIKEPVCDNSLNAPRHKGLMKEALTECGRLKKGWRYKKGGGVEKVSVKIEKKTKKGTEFLKKITLKAFKTDIKNSFDKILKDTQKLDKLRSELHVYETDPFLSKTPKRKQLEQSVKLIDSKITKSITVLSEYCNTINNDIIYVIWDIYPQKEKFEKWVIQTYSNKYNQTKLAGINVSSDRLKKMTVTDLRKFTLQYYNDNFKKDKISVGTILKEVVFTTTAGRKLAYGGAMYKEKALVIENLENVIKNSTYNNWGERKQKDSSNVLGYLNFKSKITIDGVKRHVRISIILDKKRRTTFKNFEIGKKEKGSSQKATNVNPQVEKKNLTHKCIKKTSITKDFNTESLNNPYTSDMYSATESYLSSKEMVKKTKIEPQKNSTSPLQKLGYVQASTAPKKAKNVFRLNGEIGGFIQDIQRHKELILIKGNMHSSKSQLAMQIANALGEKGLLVAYIDYEQGGLASKDTIDSLNRNTTPKGKQNIFVKGFVENPMKELEELCINCDAIVADSITDLGISADEINYLRGKYEDVIWCFISQVKSNGEMYGGNKMAHNPTKIIHCTSDKDFTKRIATLQKNRGGDITLSYNINSKKLFKDEVA